jgi:hypothetical protein
VNYRFLFVALSTLPYAAEQPAFRNSAPLDKLVHDAAAHAVERFGNGGLTADKIAITLIDLADPRIPVRAGYRGEESTYPASVVKLFYAESRLPLLNGRIWTGNDIPMTQVVSTIVGGRVVH